jgi:HSP20 family protein
MSLQHDPLSNLRLFEDAVTRMMSEPRTSRPWSPPVDIMESENELTVKADLPDVRLSDIDVRVENQTLSIKGERRFEENSTGKGYRRIERSYGSFMRSFAVPNSVDTEKVSADYKDGVLTVSLPKKEAAKARQVKVEEKKSR